MISRFDKIDKSTNLSTRYVNNLASLCFFIVSFLYTASSFAAYAPSLTWKTIETPHFLIHYPTELEDSVDVIANKAEQIHIEVSEYFNWSPVAKTHIVLSDQSEFPNGSASVFPRNRIEILMTPPTEISGLEDYDDWIALVLKHEYVHIVHLDKAADFPLHARAILGRHWMFFPNTFLPRWITEGLATHLETKPNAPFGRGQSNYYRALMRNEVIHGTKSLAQINQFRMQWPSGSSFYLYGVYFFNFLSETYGEEKIRDFVDEYSQFPLPYFINTVTKIVFKKDMAALWDEFTIYLNNDFADEIYLVQQQTSKHQFPKPVAMTNTGYLTGFTRLSEGSLYYIQANRENIKKLVKFNLKTKEQRTILTIRNQDSVFPHTFDVHPDKGILIPILETYENFRQSFDLFTINPASGKRTRLTKNKRYLKAIWNKSGTKILALGNSGGKHHLDILNSNGKKEDTLWQGERGFAINAFDWSTDENRIIISMFSPNNGWDLHLVDMQNKLWKQITFNEQIESYPRFIKNDTHILFSADYNANYNIFELSLKTFSLAPPRVSKQLTNSLTAALFPEWDDNNKRIYYSELDKNGFNVKNATVIDTVFYPLNPEKNSPVPVDTLPVVKHYSASKYSSINYLAPTWWVPLYITDENQKYFGLTTNASDPLEKHNFYTKLLYGNNSSVSETFDWEVSYINKQQIVVLLLNSRQNYFLSNYNQRKEMESTIALIYPYIKRAVEWKFYSSFQYLKTNNKFSFLNNKIRFSTSDSYTTVGASVDTTSKNLLAASPHSGTISSISYEVNKVIDSFQDHSRITFNSSIYSSVIYHAIFKAQATIIVAGNEANNTFLGGTRGSDDQTTLFGKSTYPLKGFKVNQFIGTNLQKLSLQSFFPLMFPETGLMMPPLGINRINLRTLLETARVGSYNQINTQKWHSTIALEILFRANFGYGRFPFNITAGIAKGLGEFGELQSYGGLNIRF